MFVPQIRHHLCKKIYMSRFLIKFITSWHYLALLQIFSLDVLHADVVSLEERIVYPFTRTQHSVHLQLLHTAVGAHSQLSTRRTHLGKYEPL